ncbi:MAG: hypothetical protein AB7G39_17970 [Alphaproteobacteria bacterium]
MPRPLLRLLAVFLIAAPFPVAAQEQAAAEPVEPSRRPLYKTIAYQSMSSFNDFVFASLFGGNGATGGGTLAAMSLVTEPVVYYIHENLWASARAASGQTEMEVLPTKTVTYSLMNSGRVFLSGWLYTGNPMFALGFTAFNMVGDAVTSAGNDALWAAFAPEPPHLPAGPRVLIAAP